MKKEMAALAEIWADGLLPYQQAEPLLKTKGLDFGSWQYNERVREEAECRGVPPPAAAVDDLSGDPDFIASLGALDDDLKSSKELKMYRYIVTPTTSVEIQATSAGAAAKLVRERAGHVGVVSARMATADARTIPVSQGLGQMIEAEVEDSPLHDMAWPGEVIDDAPEAVQAEYDRLVQLLGQDFPLADLVQRSGDGEPVAWPGGRWKSRPRPGKKP